MKNIDFIREYINGEDKFAVHGYLGIADTKLFNYSTEICDLDREKKVAKLNVHKYSSTTSTIQHYLRNILNARGYVIEEYDGEPLERKWDVGEPKLTRNDMKKKA